MPRFFFDVLDGSDRSIDAEGALFPTLYDAAADAARALAEDAAERGFTGGPDLAIEIRDERGERLLAIPAAAVPWYLRIDSPPPEHLTRR